jgi:response regulator RpfG family c-di-GMP phosphodiesterase
MKEVIFLVDDEPNVLSALTRELNSFQFNEIITAKDGIEAIELLKVTPNVALIISDYRMPGMDGISFLLKAQEISPDATRMILSGVADLEMATNAINLGQIFRLLLKPCSTENFITSVKAGIRQYELVTSERDLLQNTLKGSIKILTDLLAAINPDSFSQSTRISALTRKLASALELNNAWELELAGVLCRIGCVTVPPEVLEAWMKGKILDPNQQHMIESVGKVGHHLLRNIPRLEKIAEGILYQAAPFQPLTPVKDYSLIGKDIPLIGRILKIVIDYDHFLNIDPNPKTALGRLANQSNEYDLELLKSFRDIIINETDIDKSFSAKKESVLSEVSIDEIKTGMVIMGNVFDKKGRLLIGSGTLVTDIIKLRLANYDNIYGLDQTLLVRKSEVQSEIINK